MQQQPVKMQVAHEDQILEAIDQLRRRKARPDADRICNYLLRKYSVDARDTIADLHRLIEAEKVIQVDYKGNTSYRNASKWSRLQLYKNRPEGFVKEKLNSGMVASAVAELVVEEPDYLDQGVPAYRLIEQLLDGVSNPTSRRMVEDFLGKEVASGNLARLSNGNYSLVATSDMTSVTEPPRREAPQRREASSTLVLENGNARRTSKESTNNTATATTTTTTITTTATTTTTTNVNNTTTTATTTTRTTGNAARAINTTAAAAELYEFDEGNNLPVTDSRSNTSRSSRQTSPKGEQQQSSKDECCEIIVTKNGERSAESSSIELACNGKQERDSLEITSTSTTPEDSKDDSRNSDSLSSHNLKRSSKAERKQRLLVRTDDPMDIEIKFENYRRDNKDESERLKEKREEIEHFSEEREDEDAGRSSTNTSPTPSTVNSGGFRSARRKRARKVFDPSDNNLVKRKRGRPANPNKHSLSQESQDSAKTMIKEGPCRQCSLCAKEKQEALVACRDCTVRAHPSCIYSPTEILQKTNTNWQCERCKTCTACCETSDMGPLVTCFSCDEAYHYQCHIPHITASKSNSKWCCNDCLQKQHKANINQNSNLIASRPDSPSNTPVLPPVLSPQVSPARGSSDVMEDDVSKDGIDPNIPDATDWTCEQVYQYFARLFPKEAEVLRQQDVDGQSLLLLSRADVLSGFDLLLGPALKMYRHVLKLQMRRDDTKYYWL